jgi:hypothetical protein
MLANNSNDNLAVQLGLVNTDLPVFKNNSKIILALDEFISNPLVTKLCLNCDKSLLLKAFVEYLTKKSKFTFLKVEYSENISIFENYLRKSVILLIKSQRDVYEGEVLEIKRIKDENGILQCIEMTLKSLKLTKSIILNKDLIEQVNEINVGDVVYIEPNSGILQRIGRSETRINEYDLEGDKYVPLHKGGVHSTRERDIYISLFDLDFAFNKYSDDISDFTRRQVDLVVKDYLERGIAQFVCSGIYFENSTGLNSVNFYKIFNFSDLYPHVKIFIENSTANLNDNSNGVCLENAFFVLKSISEENPIDLFEYFSKGFISNEMKLAVEAVLTYDNWEKILSILSICRSVEDFKEIYV